mgnify:CR=1 FL=1
MAKKSMLERERKRAKMVARYAAKRARLKEIIRNPMSSDDEREAEEAYRSVLADWPADADMNAGLGWTLLQQGRKADARKVFEELLRWAPAHASANQGLAATQ